MEADKKLKHVKSYVWSKYQKKEEYEKVEGILFAENAICHVY